jgi:Ca2+-binding RTX toxin-like protein
MRRLLEALEERRLFSVVSYNTDEFNNLYLQGSSGNDTITVSLNELKEVKVFVGSGKSAASKHFMNISSVSIFGNDGNDTIKVAGTNLSDTPTGVVVYGGNGNDKIVIDRFDGMITVDGGAGHDFIDARNALPKFALIGPFSHRGLYGGSGNDTILGSGGNDHMMGEDGNDVLYGNAGDDYLVGGRGSNILDGGVGNDIFVVYSRNTGTGSSWDTGGIDRIYGGSGYDSVYRFYDSSFSVKPIFGDTRISIEYVDTIDRAAGGGKG